VDLEHEVVIVVGHGVEHLRRGTSQLLAQNALASVRVTKYLVRGETSLSRGGKSSQLVSLFRP
jgi:hypothetical protein